MKRIALLMIVALLMGGMVMAQQNRRDDRKADPKARAERMTERMVKEYSLNDTQKKQLLEANLTLTEKMGDRPMHHRRADMRKGKNENDSCCCAKSGHRKGGKVNKQEGKKTQMTEEQRAQMKAGMEKQREEMKAARTAYDAQLKKIMTKDQYAAYTKNMNERKDKAASDKKDVRKK